MLGERCASGGVALPSINRLIANDFHFDTVRAGECGGGRTIGGTLHVNPGIIKGAAFERRAIVIHHHLYQQATVVQLHGR